MLVVAISLGAARPARADVWAGPATSRLHRIATAAAARRGRSKLNPVVMVGAAPVSSPIASGFLGISMEYSTVSAYEGATPNGVLAALIHALAPGQTPILRIGGDSTDWAWWPTPDIRQPAGIRTALSPTWMTSANQLISTTGAHVILGLNLRGRQPRPHDTGGEPTPCRDRRTEHRGVRNGNEPQLYAVRPWYFNPLGLPQYGRGRSYNVNDYITEFQRFAAGLPVFLLLDPRAAGPGSPSSGHSSTLAPAHACSRTMPTG